jgi:hypothetical protein
MDKGRLSRTLRAKDSNNRKINVMAEPFGCQLDELCVILDRCRRYLPDVVEIVDETQLPACILRVTTGHNRIRIDLSGCGR